MFDVKFLKDSRLIQKKERSNTYVVLEVLRVLESGILRESAGRTFKTRLETLEFYFLSLNSKH